MDKRIYFEGEYIKVETHDGSILNFPQSSSVYDEEVDHYSLENKYTRQENYIIGFSEINNGEYYNSKTGSSTYTVASLKTFLDDNTKGEGESSGGGGNLSEYVRSDNVESYTKQQYFVSSEKAPSSGSISLDMDDDQISYFTVIEDSNVSATNVKNSAIYIISVTQGGSGGYTITWGPEFRFGDSPQPTLSTDIGKTDIITFMGDKNGNLFYLGHVLGHTNFQS